MDAFTDTPFAGNPAGVVPEADGLTDAEMQKMAREMNCSETAFVLASDRAEMRFRYFTPAQEVDLCGHATIATLHVLGQEKGFQGGHRVETRAGVLTMEVAPDGTSWMEQAAPQWRPYTLTGLEDVAAILGLKPEDLDPRVPLALAYTGLWDLLVPVRNLAALHAARPDLSRLAAHNRALGVASTHLFTFETALEGSTLQARDFSPAVGIPEDPHTGTASGALGAYLVSLGVVAPGRMIFEQGWTVERPGLIHVEVSPGAQGVRVGGRAVTVVTGAMRLPE